MKKTMKLIATLTVITLMTGLLAVAFADDKIYTSSIFTIPKDRIEAEMLEQTEQQKPEETGKPEEKPEEGQTETRPDEKDPDVEVSGGPAERQVKISSSRKEVVIENEIITLSSKLIGFGDEKVYYQWQVDRGDGAGWVDVEGANGPTHSFVARKDTILFSWRLMVSVDD